MSECRIARRVAWVNTAGISHNHGTAALALATKVLHMPFRPCPRGGGPRQPLSPVMGNGQVVGSSGCVKPDMGVGSVGPRGGVRRVVRASGAAFTPLYVPTLSTKENEIGGLA